MLHVGKNKLLECLFKKSQRLILVKLNSSPEPETGNGHMVNRGAGFKNTASWEMRLWHQEAGPEQEVQNHGTISGPAFHWFSIIVDHQTMVPWRSLETPGGL